MRISNNRASFQLWWKENVVKHQRVSKWYGSSALVGNLSSDVVTIKILVAGNLKTHFSKPPPPPPPKKKKKDRSQNSCCIGGWADKPGPRLPVRKQAGVEKYPPGTNFPKDTLQGNQSYVKANSGQSKTSKSSNQKVIKKMVKKILTQE